jgi:NAD(P)-dependent dehydrogenase (short-subunit alcohol dehydrogenase family)
LNLPGADQSGWVKQPAFAEQVAKNVIRRVRKAEEVVGTALFLASEAGGYMTRQVIYCESGRVHTIS